jgi:Cft2 family RNA processing exonuclease
MTVYKTRPTVYKTRPTAELAHIFYKTSMARSGQRRNGRIYPHERDTNDGVPILGGDVKILEEHSVAVHETE